jgi:hypothetical protein
MRHDETSASIRLPMVHFLDNFVPTKDGPFSSLSDQFLFVTFWFKSAVKSFVSLQLYQLRLQRPKNILHRSTQLVEISN